MSPRGVLHCKNEAIRGVAKNPEKMTRFGPAAILGAPAGHVEASKNLFYDAFEITSFFGGVQFLPLAPSGRPPDVHKRYPNHLCMQKSVFQKKLVFLKKSKVFSLGIPVKIPLFRSRAATASHQDSKIQRHP